MNCLCAQTRRAARLLTQRYEEVLRPAALTPAQFELMAELAPRPATSQAALAEILALDQTTLSRNLTLLLTRGLLQRYPSPIDRRQTLYTLTPEGKAAWLRALPLWQSAQESMQHHLGDNWSIALATLNRLQQASTGDGRPAPQA